MSQPVASTGASAPELSGGDAMGGQLVALSPRVAAFVRNLCRGGVARGVGVDDLVQETMARAWRSRATFATSKGSIEAWLLRIAFRVYLDHRPAAVPPTTLLDDQPTAAPGPVAQVEARERTWRLLGLLGARERDVLLRFHRDGRSIAEMAATDAVPPGTIKSLLHRARARLWTAFLHGDRP